MTNEQEPAGQEPGGGVSVPLEAVLQAAQQRINGLMQENLMLHARTIDLDAQLAEAKAKLAAADAANFATKDGA